MTFLALLLAHLLGDFVFQWKWLIDNKGKRLGPLLFHGIVHYALAWLCLKIFAQTSFLSIYAQVIVFAYLLVHLSVDHIKSISIHKKLPDNWQVFLLDQLLHLAVLIAAACLLTHSSFAALFSGFSLPQIAKVHILEGTIIYVATVFAGGYLIRYMTKSLATDDAARSSPQLENAGLYVGWIERFLVITAIALQSAVLVGLILTIKSIARFPEFKHARFAEYFLIGTLLSVSLALIAGILLLYLLYGTVILKS